MSDHSCGGESIGVEVQATAADGGYEHLITEAIRRLSEMLPDVKIHRRRGDCGGTGGFGAGEEWYIGCAHSGISAGGQTISGKFLFVRYGSEEPGL